MASPPTKAEVLRLFWAPLRTARQFSDYIRVHHRRTTDAFRRYKSLPGPPHLSSAFCDRKGQLDVAKRQELVSKPYAPQMTSIMDLKLKPIN